MLMTTTSLSMMSSIIALLLLGVALLLLPSGSNAFVVQQQSAASSLLSRQLLRPTTVTPTTAASSAAPFLLSSTTTSTTTTTPEQPVDEQSDDSDDQFKWSKTWYPLIPVDFLDDDEPHPFTLLGDDIVVWNDAAVIAGDGSSADFGPKKKRNGAKRHKSAGTWRVMRDSCPHRQVPLSEGRIENDGSLMCSYHGWRFDGAGRVIDVPQISNQDTEMTGLQRRANCQSYPSQVIDGVIWVWGETGDDARLESALKPPAKYTLNSNEDRLWTGPWNFRELPYGHDYFIENVVDPAHVPVSHHNIVGSRYDDQRRTMKLVTDVTKDGFAFTSKLVGAGSKNESFTDEGDRTTFRAPSSVAIETSHPNDSSFTLELYSTPSRPGFCYHVGRSVIVKETDGKMPSLLRQFTLPIPTWVNHILASAFLNQDALFLHKQERYLAKTNQYASYKKTDDESGDSTTAAEETSSSSTYQSVVNPIGVDRGVLAFRSWLQKHSRGGIIPYATQHAMPPADNEVVFDVWNGHTKYCKVCQAALANLKTARFASFVVSACLAVLRPFQAKWKVLNLASVLVSAGIGLALNKLIKMFYRYEFSHAHND